MLRVAWVSLKWEFKSRTTEHVDSRSVLIVDITNARSKRKIRPVVYFNSFSVRGENKQTMLFLPR